MSKAGRHVAARVAIVVLLAAAIGQIAYSLWPRGQRVAPIVVSGDLVPSDIRLISDGRSVELADVAGAEACVVLYFFDPHCPACEEYAPNWQGVRGLGPNDAIPVAWVAMNPNEQEVDAFMERFDLGPANYRLRRVEDGYLIGIPSVPLIWGVSGDVVRHVSLQASVPNRVPLEWCEE